MDDFGQIKKKLDHIQEVQKETLQILEDLVKFLKG